MAKSLHLNSSAIYADYLVSMGECIDRLLDRYYKEVQAGFKTDGAKNDLTTEKLDSLEKGLLVRRLIGGALAVMDSWGTGSLMDTSNKALNDYIRSHFYNPARSTQPGAPITGRPEGYYENVFGETVYSSGAMEGLNLETFEGSPVTARAPSGAFQNADKWFAASEVVKEEIDKTTREFFAGVYSSAARYFSFY